MDESFLKLKGRKVLNRETGKYFGRLSDIIVNKDTNMIIGIVSRNDSLIYRQRLFLMEDISGGDELNVFVTGYGKKFVKVLPIYAPYKSCDNDIMKKNAIFSHGMKNGKIQNINFDFEAGIMAEFEIGSSIVQDLLNGRKICPTRQSMNYHGGTIIVDNNLS